MSDIEEIEDFSITDSEPSKDILDSGNRATLEFEADKAGGVSIFYAEEKNEARFGEPSKLVKHRKLLARFAQDGSKLELFPIITWQRRPPYFEPKYGCIKSIELWGFGFETPESGEDESVESMLS